MRLNYTLKSFAPRKSITIFDASNTSHCNEGIFTWNTRRSWILESPWQTWGSLTKFVDLDNHLWNNRKTELSFSLELLSAWYYFGSSFFYVIVSIHLFAYSLVRLFTCSLIHSSIHLLSIHPSIHSLFIHSFVFLITFRSRFRLAPTQSWPTNVFLLSTKMVSSFWQPMKGWIEEHIFLFLWHFSHVITGWNLHAVLK